MMLIPKISREVTKKAASGETATLISNKALSGLAFCGGIWKMYVGAYLSTETENF